VLGRYVRERGRLDLPAAVHRMTGLPAANLGLSDRGRVAPGAVADLVIFDPVTVADASTYASPTLPPIGVEAVVVGGGIAVESGKPVDVGLGRVLRRTVSGRRPARRSG
jgi:N-acyl-D-aspartate/D-glutamate deacylase